MEADPGQTKDVASEHPEVAADLKKALDSWRMTMKEELGTDERPFVIAHPGMEWTQIPARDGIAHGGIERSNKFPNDSFFTNWTSTDDWITWDAEVAESGEFEVAIYYTCDAENVGSTVELEFGDSTLSGTVDTTAESKLVGADDDRSPRAESYTQNWKSMTLGEIRLEKGEGTLKLKATEVPGEEVMDFRLLTLKRISSQ